MRVWIDGYNLAMPKGTGVAAYGVELVSNLRELGHQVTGVFGLAVPRDPRARETAFFDVFQRPPVARKVRRLRRAWRYAKAFRAPALREVALSGQVSKELFGSALPHFDGLVTATNLFENAVTSFAMTRRMVSLRVAHPPDIMHWTYPVPIRLNGCVNIYTLHDLVPVKLPSTTLDQKQFYDNVVTACIRSSSQLCTVSRSSSNDIVERYGIAPGRITNTYQAASRPKLTAADALADASTVEGVFGLTHRGYFLYCGAIEPKKNVGRLIEAYLSLQSATPLVIVGARAWQAEQELRLMPEGGASGAAGTYRGHRGQTIMRLDYLPRELLMKLVRGAKALVFPSLYEGFGLPVLEAMQLGTPVITSNTSSLPEVAGDAGILVDPYDVSALQAAMKWVDTDEALCRAMSAKGLEQAKKFSRERYQERLTELYDAALARR